MGNASGVEISKNIAAGRIQVWVYTSTVLGRLQGFNWALTPELTLGLTVLFPTIELLTYWSGPRTIQESSKTLF